MTAESHSKTRSLLGEFSYEMKKGNHPTPNEHDSPISPSPDPMGGIVLELTENVFGRVSRGLLRETPTRGEQTQPGSDGGAMDPSSIARHRFD